MTIAKVLLRGEARAGYVPNEQITTYRELVRLHTRLSDEAASYQNEIQILVVVLFPEFTQVFADPCLPSALAVSKPTLAPKLLQQQGWSRFPTCCEPRRQGTLAVRQRESWWSWLRTA